MIIMNKNLLTQSKEMSHEYCCTVVRLGEIIPIEGANTVAKTLVNGREIVIGNSHKEGEVMLYASNETQLNEDFLSANNLFEDIDHNRNYSEVQEWLEQNSDATEDERKEYLRQHRGYFDKRCRVRMKKLCKTMSMGFLFEPEVLVNWAPQLKGFDFESMVGDDFDTVGTELFIKAYVPEVKPEHHTGTGERRNKKLKKYDRMIPGQFSFHYDTQQFERNISRFNPDDEVTISIKLHGCVERNTVVNTMEFGDITIGEIVDKKINCHIKAYDVNTNSNVYVPIDNHYMVKNDGEWYEIELEDGRKITITGNNPVWLPDLETYRRVDELNGDEFLLID